MYPSSHQLDNLLADGQSHSAAAAVGGDKSLEDFLLLVGRYAASCTDDDRNNGLAGKKDRRKHVGRNEENVGRNDNKRNRKDY